MQAKDVFARLCDLAPLSLQMEGDNSGFLIGDPKTEVTTVLVALDVTRKVLEDAAGLGAQMLVTHHPLPYRPLHSLCAGQRREEHLAFSIARQGLCLAAMHTNFDAAEGGLNDILASAVGIVGTAAVLEPQTGIGRFGKLAAPMALADFLPIVKKALCCDGLRFCRGKNPAYKVAVGSGACGDRLSLAIAAGCDTYVTADVKHHEFLEAAHAGVNLIDAGHFSTENIGCAFLADYLSRQLPQVQIHVAAGGSIPEFFM